MKKLSLLFLIPVMILNIKLSNAQFITGAEAKKYVSNAETVVISDEQHLPSYIKFSHNKIISMNGNIRKYIEPNTQITLSENTALQNALNYLNASQYMWKIPQEESKIKYVTGSNNATYFPKGEPTKFQRNLCGIKCRTYKNTNGFTIFTVPLNGVIINDIEFKPGDTITIYATGQKVYKSTNSGSSLS